MRRERDLLSYSTKMNIQSDAYMPWIIALVDPWKAFIFNVTSLFDLRVTFTGFPSKSKYLHKTFPNLSDGLPQPGCQAWSLTTNEEDGYQRHVIIILAFQNQSVSFSPSISSFTIHGELLLSIPVFKCGSPWQHRSYVTGASSYKDHGTGIYFSVIRRSFSVDGNPVKPIQRSLRNTALNSNAFHWWTNAIR